MKGSSLLKNLLRKVVTSQYNFSFYPDKFNLCSTNNSFKADDLTIRRTSKPLPKPPADPAIMQFGAFHTDHLLQIDWTEQGGWGKPEIIPFQYFQIHPFASCLHYAIECFEGSKAFKNQQGMIRWFRPECNMYRMKITAQRISLPVETLLDFDGDEFIKCIVKLIRLDADWIPAINGFSAYLRPTFISTEETLGVRAPTRAKLYCVISPVGPYFATGFKPVKVYCDTKHVRSAHGGVGGYKLGSNYGPTIQPFKEVARMGYSQILWMLPDGQIQEMGVSNLFFFWKNKEGQDELVTPKLDGTILPGIVRDSVLKLARGMKRFNVVEKTVYMSEVIETINEGRMKEIFGSGTALNIQPIEMLGFETEQYQIPINPKYNSGDLSYELNQMLSAIQL